MLTRIFLGNVAGLLLVVNVCDADINDFRNKHGDDGMGNPRQKVWSFEEDGRRVRLRVLNITAAGDGNSATFNARLQRREFIDGSYVDRGSLSIINGQLTRAKGAFSHVSRFDSGDITLLKILFLDATDRDEDGVVIIADPPLKATLIETTDCDPDDDVLDECCCTCPAPCP